MAKTPNKKITLKEEAKKFLHLPSVKKAFKTPPDFRRELSPYQAKKIHNMVNQVKNALGARANEIVPIGRGRGKFLAENGFPTYARGVDLSGGEKINKKAQFVGGKFFYERGGSLRARSRIYTEGDEVDLIEDVKRILKDKPKGWKTSIAAAGRVIGSAQNMSNEAAVKEAARIFMKYAEMAANGEKRTIKGKYEVLAAHPSEWGMAVLFEQPKKKETVKNGTKKAKKK